MVVYFPPSSFGVIFNTNSNLTYILNTLMRTGFLAGEFPCLGEGRWQLVHSIQRTCNDNKVDWLSLEAPPPLFSLSIEYFSRGWQGSPPSPPALLTRRRLIPFLLFCWGGKETICFSILSGYTKEKIEPDPLPHPAGLWGGFILNIQWTWF